MKATCQDCGEYFDESDPDSESFCFCCSGCGRITCENCASGGLCFDCDTENMVETGE